VFLTLYHELSHTGPDNLYATELVYNMTNATAAPGQVIVHVGTPPGSIYMIDSGCCSVSVRGRQVAILEAGECIGEIALLSAEAHTADVWP